MIMPFEGTHYADADVSPYLAQVDEDAYCDAILGEHEHEVTTIHPDDYAADEAREVAGHTTPIPGHFHYADAAYWT